MPTSPSHNPLLTLARASVHQFGFINSVLAAQLAAHGHDVGALERRLLEAR